MTHEQELKCASDSYELLTVNSYHIMKCKQKWVMGSALVLFQGVSSLPPTWDQGTAGSGCQYPVRPLLRVMSDIWRTLRSILSKRRFHKIMEVTITKLWNFTATFRPKSNSGMCCEALAHPSHQEVKSCKILNWAEYQQIRTVSIRSWAKTRFAYSSGTRKWNPARLQSSKISPNQNCFNQVMG